MGRLSEEAAKRVAEAMKSGMPAISRNWDEERVALVRHIEARGPRDSLFIAVSDEWKEKASQLILKEYEKERAAAEAAEKAAREKAEKAKRLEAWNRMTHDEKDRVARAADRAVGINDSIPSPARAYALTRYMTDSPDQPSERWARAVDAELDVLRAEWRAFEAPLTDGACALVGAAADKEISLYIGDYAEPPGLREANIRLIRRLERGEETRSGNSKWDAAAARQLRLAREARRDGKLYPAPEPGRVTVEVHGYGVPSSAIGCYIDPVPPRPFGGRKNLYFTRDQWADLKNLLGGRDRAFKALEGIHGCKVCVTVTK